MTQEEKNILLKDLCSRVLYGVIVHFCNTLIDEELTEIGIGKVVQEVRHNGKGNQCKVLPYLRPMSSMTEDERQEARDKFFAGSDHYDIDDIGEILADTYQPYESVYTLSFPRLTGYIDWLNKKKFDYRDLISKGLALPAPEWMYKTE